jgi:hypothetical protein
MEIMIGDSTLPYMEIKELPEKERKTPGLI